MAGVLIFGRTGQLARELAKLAVERGAPRRALGRAELDLADPNTDLEGAIGEAIARHAPDMVINASGYTAVDRAEDEAAAAFRLNRDAPAAMAQACAAASVPFVHVSTDYVFDGKNAEPYREDDPVHPQGVYGASKAEGEAEVGAAGGRAVTLRTSWVYAAEGANFVRTMLRLAETRDEVSVVSDQRGRPTWARDLGEAALAAGEALAADRLMDQPILHVSGEGETTWAGLAEAVFEGSRARGGPYARVRPISTAEYPTRAARPANSRLDLSRARERLHWTPRPWRQALDLCLDELFPSARRAEHLPLSRPKSTDAAASGA